MSYSGEMYIFWTIMNNINIYLKARDLLVMLIDNFFLTKLTYSSNKYRSNINEGENNIAFFFFNITQFESTEHTEFWSLLIVLEF